MKRPVSEKLVASFLGLMSELRDYNPNERPAGMGNYYCPVCSCRKTGWVDEPNGRDEGCRYEACLCHSESTVTP